MSDRVLERLFLELSQVVGEGTQTAREFKLETAMKVALRYLDRATPSQRNGPVYMAADTIRTALRLPPMHVGGKPSEGLDP